MSSLCKKTQLESSLLLKSYVVDGVVVDYGPIFDQYLCL